MSGVPSLHEFSNNFTVLIDSFAIRSERTDTGKKGHEDKSKSRVYHVCLIFLFLYRCTAEGETPTFFAVSRMDVPSCSYSCIFCSTASVYVTSGTDDTGSCDTLISSCITAGRGTDPSDRLGDTRSW